MKNLFNLLLFLAITNSVLSQNIVINEILSSNSFSNMDEDGSYQDWIELYNNGATTENLSGYGLSDDATILYKWTFPSVSIAPGEYLLVWASDKNRTVAGSPLHTNFKLAMAGNAVLLTNPSGTTVDMVPSIPMQSDISYGRLPNGSGAFVFFQAITPNAVNSNVGYSELLTPPTFSQNSGFFTAGFDLTLSSTIPGTTVLYTLDGSDPDENNLSGTTYNYKNQYPEFPGDLSGSLLQKSFQTLQYSTPIPIIDRSAVANKIASISTTYSFNPTYIPANPVFKGTVLKAKLIKPGALSSTIETKNYFISPQGNNRFTLPVMSLSIPENKLFDYNDGILVAGVDFDTWRTANPTLEPPTSGATANFFRSGIANERIANMNYFVNGINVLNQNIGLRVHGGSSRVAQNKSFNISAKTIYGDNSMSYPFFNDKPFDSYSDLVLHNSGNDFDQTMFRDALCQELMKSLNVVTKGYQPVITFVNGEYWGILSARDKIDSQYFKRVFNIPTSEIELLEEQYIILEGGDNSNYLDMINYVTNNSLAIPTNYDYIKTRLDPENFTDYFISNIFFGNGDWPMNNILYWRKKTASYEPNAPYGNDGRWRWLAHDMDDTFSISNPNFDTNNLAIATAPNGIDYPNPAWSTFLLRKMLENNDFKIDFVNRFADLLNTSFLSSTIITKMNEMKTVLAPEVLEQSARWAEPIDIGDWNYFLNFQTNFANARPAIQRDHIRLQFGITSNVNATLNVSNTNHGYIKMNSVAISEGTPGIVSNPYPWTGIYFNGIPVKLKAIAKPGFIFSGWSGASISTNPEITVTPTADFSITANFIPDATYEISVPIYYWYMDGLIANNVPLETLNSTYSLGANAFIQYKSCLAGYPFPIGNVNRNKASMERRNSPTNINYNPAANNNLAYNVALMKGLQIKQFFQNGGLENLMIFNLSTTGFKNIKLSFAAINELAGINGISVDYSINSGTPIWLTSGLSATSLPLFSAYQLLQIDCSAIASANNNADFKIRLRFTGPDLTLDAGNRVTFNNISVDGVQLPLIVDENNTVKFKSYPNPFSDTINIVGINNYSEYTIYTIDGKLLKNGVIQNTQIQLSDLSKGMYLLQIASEGKKETHKIIKN
ncbi:Listeria/Bacterioides repeat [Flavobacteriaceae bacterium]